MSHSNDQGDSTGAAKPERFRFSLAQLLGIVLSLGLVMGTLRLVMADSSQPKTSLVAGFGFAAAAIVFLRVVNAKATLTEYVVVAVIMGLLAAWLMPAIRPAKEAPSRIPLPAEALPIPTAGE